jgi:hypothetical protein
MSTATHFLDLNHAIRIDYKVTHHFIVEHAKQVSDAFLKEYPSYDTENSHAVAVRGIVEEMKKQMYARGLTDRHITVDMLFFPNPAEATKERGGYANWNGFSSGHHVCVAAVRRAGDVAYSSIIVPALKSKPTGSDYDIKYYVISPIWYENETHKRVPKGLQYEYRDITRAVRTIPSVVNIVVRKPSITLPKLLSNLYHRLAQPMHRKLAEFYDSVQKAALNRFALRLNQPIQQDTKAWLIWFDAVAKGESPSIPTAMTNLLSEYRAAIQEAEKCMLSFEYNKAVMFVQLVKDGETYAVLPNDTFVQATPDAPIPVEAMHRAQAVVMQKDNMQLMACSIFKYPGASKVSMVAETYVRVLPGIGVELQNNQRNSVSYPAHKLIVVPVSDAELAGVSV